MSEMKYYCCPFCGWVRPIKYGFSLKEIKQRQVSFDKVDPARIKVIQVRELSGGVKGMPRGGHIKTVEATYLKDLGLPEKMKIKSQCEKILKALNI